MPDHDIAVGATFANGHVATTARSISVSPVVVATITPVITIIAAVTIAAVWPDAEVELGEGQFGLGSIPSISGGCRESKHYARDGDDE
jgi:hypothetical protein